MNCCDTNRADENVLKKHMRSYESFKKLSNYQKKWITALIYSTFEKANLKLTKNTENITTEGSL